MKQHPNKYLECVFSRDAFTKRVRNTYDGEIAEVRNWKFNFNNFHIISQTLGVIKKILGMELILIWYEIFE